MSTPHTRFGIAPVIFTLGIALVAGFLPRWNPSGADIRNDPRRPKTDEDLRKLEAARLKRERKNKK